MKEVTTADTGMFLYIIFSQPHCLQPLWPSWCLYWEAVHWNCWRLFGLDVLADNTSARHLHLHSKQQQ